jgi:hypothetical protein
MDVSGGCAQSHATKARQLCAGHSKTLAMSGLHSLHPGDEEATGFSGLRLQVLHLFVGQLGQIRCSSGAQ